MQRPNKEGGYVILQDVNFIIAKKEDIEGVLSIEISSFSNPWTKENLKLELENKNSYFVICKMEREILGYAIMYYVLDESNIVKIVVSSKYRNLKIGNKILDNLIEYSYKKYVKKIFLEVRKSNIIAQRLYKSKNFEKIGSRKNFYSKPTEDAVIMMKYL